MRVYWPGGGLCRLAAPHARARFRATRFAIIAVSGRALTRTPQDEAPFHRGVAGRYGDAGGGGGGGAAGGGRQQSAAAISESASPGAERFFGRANERLYEAYSQLHTMAQDFDKPFDSPAILVVGHQTDGKSGASVRSRPARLTPPQRWWRR